jgi:hypothetical protein
VRGCRRKGALVLSRSWPSRFTNNIAPVSPHPRPLSQEERGVSAPIRAIRQVFLPKLGPQEARLARLQYLRERRLRLKHLPLHRLRRSFPVNGEAAPETVRTHRFPACGVSAYTPMCPEGTEGALPPIMSSPPKRSVERGPPRTLRHKVPDRLTPSGMTAASPLAPWGEGAGVRGADARAHWFFHGHGHFDLFANKVSVSPHPRPLSQWERGVPAASRPHLSRTYAGREWQGEHYLWIAVNMASNWSC